MKIFFFETSFFNSTTKIYRTTAPKYISKLLVTPGKLILEQMGEEGVFLFFMEIKRNFPSRIRLFISNDHYLKVPYRKQLNVI